MLKELLKVNSIDINFTSSYDNLSPIMICVQNGNIEGAGILLNYNADISIRSYFNQNLLHLGYHMINENQELLINIIKKMDGLLQQKGIIICFHRIYPNKRYL